MIDTHCHLTFPQLATRLDEVLEHASDEGVNRMITVAVSSDNCVESLALADAHPNVWCSAGVHPLYADQPRDWAVVRATAEHPRCVAWGELGLDNHYDKPPRPLQDTVLREQLDMIARARADGVDLPVIVHCRDAFAELVPVLRASGLPPARFVFHCFTGNPDDARLVLDFGAWLSFTGVVTFQNARPVAEAAQLVPDDRIMVETDAPYLTPEPHRKVFPNEPRYVVHTARALAALRGTPEDAFGALVDANAERFFGLESP